MALAVYDLDRTLWITSAHTPGGFLPPPYERTGVDAVRAGDGRLLELLPGARAALESWAARGTLLSLISANDYEPCAAILRCLGLLERFLHPQIAWEDRDRGTCDKAALMLVLLSRLEADGLGPIEPREVLFVDDRAENVERVSRLGVRCLHFGVDLQRHEDVFDRLEAEVRVG